MLLRSRAVFKYTRSALPSFVSALTTPKKKGAQEAFTSVLHQPLPATNIRPKSTVEFNFTKSSTTSFPPYNLRSGPLHLRRYIVPEARNDNPLIDTKAVEIFAEFQQTLIPRPHLEPKQPEEIIENNGPENLGAAEQMETRSDKDHVATNQGPIESSCSDDCSDEPMVEGDLPAMSTTAQPRDGECNENPGVKMHVGQPGYLLGATPIMIVVVPYEAKYGDDEYHAYANGYDHLLQRNRDAQLEAYASIITTTDDTYSPLPNERVAHNEVGDEE